MDEKKRIVLIEDNEADVFLIERALAAMRRPFKTSRFQDGVDALPVLLASPDTLLPDLILLDLNMPRSNGLDILRQIRSSPKLADIPVGILTGSDASSDRKRASTIGATCYIHKVSHYDAFVGNLGQAIEAMLDEPERKAPPTEAISGTPDSRSLSKGRGA